MNIMVTWDMYKDKGKILLVWVFNLNLLFDIWKETHDL